jgi:hypothetical protein
MTTSGNFARLFIDGYEVTGDANQLTYQHTYAVYKVLPENVGVQSYGLGEFNPKLTLGGYAKHGSGALAAANLLWPSGDSAYLITELLGSNAAPAQGDVAVLFYGTLTDYVRQNTLNLGMVYQAGAVPRGLRMPPFPILQWDQQNFKTATNVSNTPYDDGAETASGTTLGGVAVVNVYKPTGSPAVGSIGVPTQPNAADTVTVNGIPYTWRSALTPTPGEVLIGATALASAQNLYAALVGSPDVAGTAYAGGTTSFAQNMVGGGSTAIVYFGPPSGVNNTIAITYAQTGTAGNAFTLAKTGSGGLTLSGATLTGGVNGDTYTLTLASSTSSGGSYTTFATISNVGANYGAYRVEVPIGTLINEWIKCTATLSSGSGTVQTVNFAVVFGRYFA